METDNIRYPDVGDLIQCSKGIGLVIKTSVIKYAGLVGTVHFADGSLRKVNLSFKPITILSSVNDEN
tara:strand:- start:11331 stop:11531 length:201 start_codon:yes stop_codon:yes gene_type:complete